MGLKRNECSYSIPTVSAAVDTVGQTVPQRMEQFAPSQEA